MTYGVVDLFCGVGGLTCGLEAAGLDVVAGYDLDSIAILLISANSRCVEPPFAIVRTYCF